MNMKLIIDNYHFSVYPNYKYIRLMNPPNLASTNDQEHIKFIFFFAEIEQEDPHHLSLIKYPFKKALDKYKRLVAFA